MCDGHLVSFLKRPAAGDYLVFFQADSVVVVFAKLCNENNWLSLRLGCPVTCCQTPGARARTLVRKWNELIGERCRRTFCKLFHGRIDAPGKDFVSRRNGFLYVFNASDGRGRNGME